MSLASPRVQGRILYTVPTVPTVPGVFILPSPVRSSKWVGLDGLSDRTKGSLIPETLQGMENDEEFQLVGKFKLSRYVQYVGSVGKSSR